MSQSCSALENLGIKLPIVTPKFHHSPVGEGTFGFSAASDCHPECSFPYRHTMTHRLIVLHYAFIPGEEVVLCLNLGPWAKLGSVQKLVRD